MTPGVRVLVRVAVRNGWRKLVVFAIVAAVACGFVLTAVTGARRSDTAWSRLLFRTSADVALVTVAVDRVDEVRTSLLRSTDVAAAGAFNWIPAQPRGLMRDEIGLFAGIGPGFGTTVYRPIITRGRLPDPARADEVTINAELAVLAHLDVGDRTHFVGPGIDQPATIVGIQRTPLDIGLNGGSPSAQGTPAFAARWFPGVRELFGPSLRPAIAVRFRPGIEVATALRRIAHDYPDAGVVSPAALNSDPEKGFGATTAAFLLLAAASALATLVLLTLLASRLLRDGPTPDVLSALGTTRQERALAAWLPVAAATIAGLLLGQGAAIAASPLVRTGIVKVADPVTGLWVDGAVLVLAAGALGALLLAASFVAAFKVASTRAAREVAVRPAAVTRLAASSPAAIVGLCAAVGGMRVATRRVTRSSLVGVMLAGTMGVGALVWHASLDRLTESPRLHGWDFDLYAYSAASEDAPDLAEIRRRLVANPNVRGLTHYARFQLTVAGIDLDVFGLAHVRGAVHPTMQRGREPHSRDEVTLGPATIRRLGLDLGDSFTVRAASGRKVRLTVVGEAVFPLIGNTGFGDTFSTTMQTVRHLGATTNEEGFFVDLRDSSRAVTALQRSLGDGVVVRRPFLPPSLVRLRDARGIELALVGFSVAFLAVVFGFGLVTTATRQHREYAVVRVLGMNRRQVTGSFGWQAIATGAATAVVTLTLGTAAGRVAWRLTSRNLAVLDSFSLPLHDLAVAVIAALLGMLGVAGFVSLRSTRRAVGPALRTE